MLAICAFEGVCSHLCFCSPWQVSVGNLHHSHRSRESRNYLESLLMKSMGKSNLMPVQCNW